MLDWAAAEDLVACSRDASSAQQALLSIANELGPRLVGLGSSTAAWSILGVSVSTASLGSISGYCEPNRRGRRIVVNSSDHPRRQRFTIAHEIAHLLMARVDRVHSGLSARQEEALCDEFAQRLLVPPSDLRAHWNPLDDSPTTRVIMVCARYRVSLSVALRAASPHLAREQTVVLAAQNMGHPARPKEIALRTLGSRCGDVLIPKLVRLTSLGFPSIVNEPGPARRGYALRFELKLWRPAGVPRSGDAIGPASWATKPLRSGIVLAQISTTYLDRSWAKATPAPAIALAA